MNGFIVISRLGLVSCNCDTNANPRDPAYRAFKAGFKGEIPVPGDGAYDTARPIWNSMIDKRPAGIARCTSTSDVVRGVNLAHDNELVLAVRGGAEASRCSTGAMRQGQRRPVIGARLLC